MSWTYQDAVEHLLDIFDMEGTSRNRRQCCRAVDEVYREMPQRCQWSYFDRHLSLQTTAPQTDGTIAFDYTGGAYERLVTLTGATWPSWAKYGRFTQSRLKYEVDRVIDSTRLTLKESSNPGADIASGTAYGLERIQYELPTDFHRMSRLFDTLWQVAVWVTTPQDVRDHAQIVFTASSYPYRVAVTSTGDTIGRMCLEFTPPPATSRSYDMYYEAMPRPIRIERESTGTVSTTADSATVTGSSTTFSNLHVGSIIRFSSDATRWPSGLLGSRDDDKSVQYVAERQVIAVTSATSLVVDSALDTTYSGVKYTISDPIDVEPISMWTAFLKMAEAALARNIRAQDYQVRVADADRALIRAKENDQRTQLNKLSVVGAFVPTITTVNSG